MVIIKLNGYGGKYEAIVCDCHYDLVKNLNWNYDGRYARNTVGRRKTYLHKLICPDGMVDHINRNKLDNRCSNLRIATYSENIMNTGIRSDNTSGVKGVVWVKRTNKWMVRFREKFIGYYETLEEATKARQMENDKWLK
jgi:hypothetical protein